MRSCLTGVLLCSLCILPTASAQQEKTPTKTSDSASAPTTAHYWGFLNHPTLAGDVKCADCHAVADLTTTGAWLANFKPSGPEFKAVHNSWPLNAAPTRSLSGLVLSQPDTATRALLDLPGKDCVVVDGVCPAQTEAAAGLRKHDIVLLMNDKPANIAGLRQALVKRTPMTLAVLRSGRKTKLTQKARISKPKKSATPRYVIGVSLGEIEPVVRAQLELDDHIKVFVKNVSKDGAAEKAGIKVHDIILKVNDKPASDSDVVQARVRDSKGKPIRLKLLRARAEVDVEVKPTNAKSAAVQYWFTPKAPTDYVFPRVPLNAPEWRIEYLKPNHAKKTGSSVGQRLSNIERKLDELARLMKALKQQDR